MFRAVERALLAGVIAVVVISCGDDHRDTDSVTGAGGIGGAGGASGTAGSVGGGVATSGTGGAIREDGGRGGGNAAGEVGGAGGTSGTGGSGETSGEGGASGEGDNPSGGSGGGTVAGGGIAERYPRDQAIASDPAVIFADDFESYGDAGDLWDRWANTYQQDQTHIVTDFANVYAGNRSLSFTLPPNDEELSNALENIVAPEVDRLYLRWYQKIDGNDDIVGSHHNGGGISAHYQGPGQRAQDANHFLVAYESWRGEEADVSPGLLNAYVYHFDQRDIWGDHFFPTGVVMPNTSLAFDFGPDFVARQDITPELDRWYCHELMVHANTVGARDGRITLWLDGALIADFGNLFLRDDPTVKIDRYSVMFHARANPGVATTKYVDNVVAATAYIGPMAP